MRPPLNLQSEFRIIKRAQSFAHAWRGIKMFLLTTPNAWIHLLCFTGVCVLGLVFHLSSIEWALIILASGFVFVSEAFNTAIEIDINLTSPEQHPYARDTKDVAAGAVLLSAITSLAIGLLVFGSRFIALIE